MPACGRSCIADCQALEDLSRASLAEVNAGCCRLRADFWVLGAPRICVRSSVLPWLLPATLLQGPFVPKAVLVFMQTGLMKPHKGVLSV